MQHPPPFPPPSRGGVGGGGEGRRESILLRTLKLLQPPHQVHGQLATAFATDGGDSIHRAFPFQLFKKTADAHLAFSLGKEIHFIQHQPTLPPGELWGCSRHPCRPRAVEGCTSVVRSRMLRATDTCASLHIAEFFKLRLDGLDPCREVGVRFQRRHIHQMQQYARTRQMPEKLMSQTRAFGGICRVRAYCCIWWIWRRWNRTPTSRQGSRPSRRSLKNSAMCRDAQLSVALSILLLTTLVHPSTARGRQGCREQPNSSPGGSVGWC